MNETIDERRARMGLCCVSEPADPQLTALVAYEGAAKVWQSLTAARSATAWGRRRTAVDPTAVEAQTLAIGARFVVPGDDEWPAQLEDLDRAEAQGEFAGAPFGLWVRGAGHLAHWSDTSVAIVGSRASTSYGETVATDLAVDLGVRGVTVVSGGAYGIDACAHRGAIAADGRTICVQAGGVDRPYPRGNAALLRTIATDHLLVSELPPGAHPTRMRFLSRNRLIAALSQATIVVEAGVRSGAKNTTSWALGCGRSVLAVPGSIHSAMSVGTHEMIRDNKAGLVTNAAEVMDRISPMGQQMLPLVRGRERVLDALDATQRAVFEVVPGRGAIGAGEVALRTGLDLGTALAALASVAERGLLDQTDMGQWKLVPGSVG